MACATTYHILAVDGVYISYISAGLSHLPTLLLLHGFPSSNNQYRNLIPLLAPKYHILAPSLPGFGPTSAPSSFVYTFDSLTKIISSFLEALKVTEYTVCMFDYSAPVPLRLALQNPKSVRAIITQNGNAYAEEQKDAHAERDAVREKVFTLKRTKARYVSGTPEQDLALIDPAAYTLDYLENIQGNANQERQLDLFYDYRTSVEMYPAFQQYFCDSQVPLLAVWGKHDKAFIPPGAEAFKNDLPNAEIHFVDAGHFALETKLVEISTRMLAFLQRIGY